MQMKHPITRALGALLLGTAISAPATAQEAPAFLQGFPDLTYEGEIGGMDAWQTSRVDGLFLVSPDGRTVVGGSVFNSHGRDIGAAYTGAEPNTAFETSSRAAPGDAPSASGDGAQTPETSGTAAVDAAAQDSGDDAPSAGDRLVGSSDTCTSPILDSGRMFPSGADPVAAATGDAEAETVTAEAAAGVSREAGLGGMDAASVGQDAQAALAEFTSDERRQMLLALVRNLRSAEDEESFRQAVLDWRKEIDRMRAEKGLDPFFTESGNAPRPADDETAETNSGSEEVGLAPQETSDIVEMAQGAIDEAGAGNDSPATTDTETSLATSLLEDARRNTLWFGLGDADAPTVYAVVDPTCPYSARAIASLSDEIGERELQLRIVMAPVVSERAPGLISAILQSEEPPLAFFNHMVDKEKYGRSDLEAKPFESLQAVLRQGIKDNYDTVVDYEIPGVPFFVYETEAGAETYSGIPPEDPFSGALVDDYQGNS